MGSIILNLFVIGVILFFIFINKYLKTPTISIVQIQNIMWLIAYLIYISGVMKYYAFDDRVYIFSIIYIIAFNITYLGKNVRKLDSYEEYEFAVESICEKKKTSKVIFSSIVAWGLAIPVFRKSIPFLMGYGLSSGMNQLRYRIYGGYNFYSTMEMCLIDFLIRPIFMVTIILFAEQVAVRKINFKLLVVAIIDALTLVLLTAGRTMMVSLVLYVFFAVITVNGANLIAIIRRYRRYVILAVAVLVLFVSISSNRVNRGEGILYEIILYYFSGLPFFSALLKEGTAQAFFTHGLSTFSPIVDTIILFLRFFGVAVAGGSQKISVITNTGLAVGEGIATNATASTLLAFYLDFGWLGPLISGLLIGIFACHYEKKMARGTNCLNFGQYLFCMVALATSMQNYAFLGVGNMVVWCLMLVLFNDRPIVRIGGRR